MVSVGLVYFRIEATYGEKVVIVSDTRVIVLAAFLGSIVRKLFVRRLLLGLLGLRGEGLVAALTELLDDRGFLLLVHDELLVHDLLDEARLVLELPVFLMVHPEPVLLALNVHVQAELVELLQNLLDVLVLADLAAGVEGDKVARGNLLRELESLNDALT